MALLEVVRKILPSGGTHWTLVAEQYKEASGEEELRNPDSVKTYWKKTMCNNNMKPTGSSGGDHDLINRAQKVERDILAKVSAKSIGSGATMSAGEESGSGDSDDELSFGDENGQVQNLFGSDSSDVDATSGSEDEEPPTKKSSTKGTGKDTKGKNSKTGGGGGKRTEIKGVLIDLCSKSKDLMKLQRAQLIAQIKKDEAAAAATAAAAVPAPVLSQEAINLILGGIQSIEKRLDKIEAAQQKGEDRDS